MQRLLVVLLGYQAREVFHFPVKQYIARLNISVDYMALFVQILEGLRHLLDDFLGN